MVGGAVLQLQFELGLRRVVLVASMSVASRLQRVAFRLVHWVLPSAASLKIIESSLAKVPVSVRAPARLRLHAAHCELARVQALAAVAAPWTSCSES